MILFNMTIITVFISTIFIKLFSVNTTNKTFMLFIIFTSKQFCFKSSKSVNYNTLI